MAIIANNIPSSGMSHIYPLEFSWQQPIFPPEGLLDLSSKEHDNVQLSLQRDF